MKSKMPTQPVARRLGGARQHPRSWLTASLVLMFLPATVPAIDVQNDILVPAQQLQGLGYCQRGVGPSCFDCSGFVTRLYRPYVPDLPRVSRDMARFGDPVSREQLKPGDLVFFATGGRSDLITHVAVYMGQDSIIHAISDGPNRGVTITPMSARYWSRRYHSAVRVLRGSVAREPASDSNRVEGLQFATGTYSGPLKDGEPHGTGVMVMDNGDRYQGEFANGFFEGTGQYRWVDGSRYDGEFKNGALHGQGTIISPDGTRISGTWESGTRVAAEGAGSAGAGASGAGSGRSGDAGSSAEPGRETTALQRADSPWNDWDGVVAGDFYAWFEQDQQAFEEWKKSN